MRLKNVVKLFCLTAVFSCSFSYGEKMESDNIFGAWKLLGEDTECPIRHIYYPSGVYVMLAGESVSAGTYKLKKIEGRTGAYSLATEIDFENGKSDCYGSVSLKGGSSSFLSPIKFSGENVMTHSNNGKILLVWIKS